MIKKIITILVLPLLLTNCGGLTGEEIGRLKINKVSSKNNISAKEVILELKAGEEIIFWSDMDISYKNKAELRFRVQIYKDGQKFKDFKIDPMKKSITMGEVKTELMDETNWSFTGKNSELKILEDGSYRFGAILISSENPTINIKKAELIIKK